MTRIFNKVDLTELNTFKVHVQASFFSTVNEPDDLAKIDKGLMRNNRILVLGGGANLLFTNDFEGIILKNEIKGKKVIKDDEDSVTLRIAGGESWHNIVMWTVNNDWSGIENLAYIPGTVGGAAVQNIAAYGQNFEDVFLAAKGIFLNSGRQEVFNSKDCHFSYRDSIFKNDLRGKFFITSVDIRLSKKFFNNTNYYELSNLKFSLRDELEKSGIKRPFKPLEIAKTVMRIRKIKQPDWHVVGTAGSFFKNPVIPKIKYEELANVIKNLQAYPADKLQYLQNDFLTRSDSSFVKIPAARLLDELGWKGKRLGRVGTHQLQALAIINYGGATGNEILDFSELMKQDMTRRFGIELEREVVVV